MGLAEAEAEEVILIDVHTGLGPTGVGYFIVGLFCYICSFFSFV
jgi:hypothetical protein